VIRVVNSEISKTEQKGTMFRKRMSKKKNVYKQLIAPFDKYLPPLFMLTDQKIVETKPRVVTFKIGGWKDKWPQAIF
jgi:hypothetical protein